MNNVSNLALQPSELAVLAALVVHEEGIRLGLFRRRALRMSTEEKRSISNLAVRLTELLQSQPQLPGAVSIKHE